MPGDKIAELEKTALELRKLVIEMLAEAGSGHSAGPLGMADVFAALYFNILNVDPKNPKDPKTDLTKSGMSLFTTWACFTNKRSMIQA